MYNKLFSKILDSSIWLEPNCTRIVWVTLLASMDEDGFCSYACPMNVANRAIVPLNQAEQALKTLESPDPNSADPEYEGRRIERVPGGWMVLNAAKYRALATRETIRESNRRRAQTFRDRKRNASVTEHDACVTGNNASSCNQKHIQNKTSLSELCSSDEEQTSVSSDGEKSKRPPIAPSPEAVNLAQLLKAEILRNKPDYKITPSQENNWAVIADRMLRLDGRKPEQVAEVIRWAQRDEFGMSNILSMDTLRKKFDQLQLKAKATPKPAKPNAETQRPVDISKLVPVEPMRPPNPDLVRLTRYAGSKS